MFKLGSGSVGERRGAGPLGCGRGVGSPRKFELRPERAQNKKSQARKNKERLVVWRRRSYSGHEESSGMHQDGHNNRVEGQIGSSEGLRLVGCICCIKEEKSDD